MAEIARRYSKALLDIAVEENKLSEYLEQAIQLKNILNDQEEFTCTLTHPQISTDSKLKLIRDIFTGRANESLIGFLCVIICKNRENQLKNIIDDFITLSHEKLGIVTAYISSPTNIPNEALNKISDTLSRKLGKRIMMDCTVDESLIGGIVLNVDGMIFDNSIKKQLSDLKKSLINTKIM